MESARVLGIDAPRGSVKGSEVGGLVLDDGAPLEASTSPGRPFIQARRARPTSRQVFLSDRSLDR
ncbi:MAG: hypothetical protein HRU14_09415 [Planctomycetes bacterium]|nr:hypothetical protein [Planctomycetota bacterium]